MLAGELDMRPAGVRMLLLSCCAAASAYTLGATSRPAVQRWRAACGVQMFGSVEEIDKSQWCMKVDNAPGLVVVFFYARSLYANFVFFLALNFASAVVFILIEKGWTWHDALCEA